MRVPTQLLVFVVLQLSGKVQVTAEQATEAPPPARAIQPTRESIYQHLTDELQAALGAEQHIKDVFAGVAEGMRDAVRANVMPGLQALVDGVVERAEDAWVAADEAGRTVDVRACVDGAEGDAQQVVKRALEKMRGCVEAVEDEGARRVREAARLLDDIEGVSKRFVTSLEACIKEEEAKETAQAEADAQAPPPEDVSAATVPVSNPAAPSANDSTHTADTTMAVTERGSCLKDGTEGSSQTAQRAKGKSCGQAKDSQAEVSSSPDEAAPTEENVGPKQKCKERQLGSTCKKTVDGEVPQEEKTTSDKISKKQRDEKKKDGKGKTTSVEEETETGEIQDDLPGVYDKTEKNYKQSKGKKGKEMKEEKVSESKHKGKEKGKKSTETFDESEGQTSSERKKDEKKGKGKHKKSKGGENLENTSKEVERKKSKETGKVDTAEIGGKNAESEGKMSKKHGKNEDGKGKKKGAVSERGSGEEQKSRKKRDVSAVNEGPSEDGVPEEQQPSNYAAAASAAAAAAEESWSGAGAGAGAGAEEEEKGAPWPQEGSTPEERRVIACMRSLTMKPLVDEKNRAYQRLQAVLQRTAAKEKDAPTCVSDQVRKAELKIAAIKQRMASCAERKMRQEL